MKRSSLAVLLVTLLAILPACAPSVPPGPSTLPPAPVPTSGQLLVAAASDLQVAFGEIAVLYKQQTGQEVVITFSSTGTLAQQIENGAPFDLFAAADISYIDGLNAKGLVIPESRQLYALGRVVLAVNKKFAETTKYAAPNVSPLTGQSLVTALSSASIKQISIANPEHAPYGRAAMQAMQSAGIWDQVKSKLVLGENVSQARQYVQTGNAEVGLIALSVANVPELSFTLIDAGLHQPLNQMLAVLKQTKKLEAANAFIAFVNGPQGRPIMKKYGFVLPGEL